MNPSVGALGIVWAFLVLGILIGVFGQVLDGRATSGVHPTGNGPVTGSRNDVIVPLTLGTDVCSAAYLACQVAKPYGATVILAYVMDLPLTLSLDAALPEWEADAERALATGQLIVEQQSLRVESLIIRHRSIAGATMELARIVGAREIIVTTHRRRSHFFRRLDPTVTKLLRWAPCRVIVAESLAHPS